MVVLGIAMTDASALLVGTIELMMGYLYGTVKRSVKHMLIAQLTLPPHNLPCEDWRSSLHGWWVPPPYVIEFWSCGCRFAIADRPELVAKTMEIIDSYEECQKKFYRENAL